MTGMKFRALQPRAYQYAGDARCFIPALWLAASYFRPQWVAAIGAVYLVGRVIYLRAYVSIPRRAVWAMR